MSGAEWKALILSSLAYTIGVSVSLYGGDLSDWKVWFFVILGGVVTIPCATAVILINQPLATSRSQHEGDGR